MKPELMTSFAERQARIAEKRRIILRFLREEIWTTAELVAALLCFATRAPAYQTLKAMERDGLLRSHAAALAYGRTVTLWGLTPHGLAFAFDDDEPLQEISIFQPSRVSVSQMSHKIELQRLHIEALKEGWTSWVDGHNLNMGKGDKIPDAVAVTASGERVAIELERTVKSAKRYYEIVVSYTLRRKANGWQEVRYYCPDESIRRRVEQRIHEIKHLSIRGQIATPEQVKGVLSMFKVLLYTDMITRGQRKSDEN